MSDLLIADYRLLRATAVVVAGLWLWATPLAAPFAEAQDKQEVVGRIEGDDIAVKGQVTLVRAANPRPPALWRAELASGSEVTVRTGQARLTLTDGSEIDICGPAQFSVLRSGDAITVALNHGRLHGRLSPALPLTVYTAQLVVTPISISGRPREDVIGLELGGGMCVQAMHGAARVEQQLTGTNIIIPQAGEVALPEGQIESLREAPGSCRCDVVLVEDVPQPSSPRVATTSAKSESEKNAEPKPPAAAEDPKWTVVMPPLTFDAKSLVPSPAPNPELATLIREVRVQPTVVFHGRVESRAKPVRGKNSAATGSQVPTDAKEKKEGVFAKIRGFFRRLFGGKAKNQQGVQDS